MGVELTDVDVVDAAECLRLVATRSLGRIGVTISSLPAILPVRYELVDDVVVARLEHGAELAAAAHHVIVAFEVDDLDPCTGAGWSVLIRGFGRALRDPLTAIRSDDGRRPSSSEMDRHRFLSISTDVVSGYRVRHGGRELDLDLTEVSR